MDIELSAPSLNQACFGHPPVPPGALASNGPAHDCVVDKIQEFAVELAEPGTHPKSGSLASPSISLVRRVIPERLGEGNPCAYPHTGRVGLPNLHDLSFPDAVQAGCFMPSAETGGW